MQSQVAKHYVCLQASPVHAGLGEECGVLHVLMPGEAFMAFEDAKETWHLNSSQESKTLPEKWYVYSLHCWKTWVTGGLWPATGLKSGDAMIESLDLCLPVWEYLYQLDAKATHYLQSSGSEGWYSNPTSGSFRSIFRCSMELPGWYWRLCCHQWWS